MENSLYAEIDRLQKALADEQAMYRALTEMHEAAKADYYAEVERLRAELAKAREEKANLECKASALQEYSENLQKLLDSVNELKQMGVDDEDEYDCFYDERSPFGD